MGSPVQSVTTYRVLRRGFRVCIWTPNMGRLEALAVTEELVGASFCSNEYLPLPPLALPPHGHREMFRGGPATPSVDHLLLQVPAVSPQWKSHHQGLGVRSGKSSQALGTVCRVWWDWRGFLVTAGPQGFRIRVSLVCVALGKSSHPVSFSVEQHLHRRTVSQQLISS